MAVAASQKGLGEWLCGGWVWRRGIHLWPDPDSLHQPSQQGARPDSWRGKVSNWLMQWVSNLVFYSQSTITVILRQGSCKAHAANKQWTPFCGMDQGTQTVHQTRAVNQCSKDVTATKTWITYVNWPGIRVIYARCINSTKSIFSEKVTT